MDFWEIVTSVAAREITATAVLVAAVIALFAGVLVPGRTHRRELDAANAVAEHERAVSAKKDVAIAKLLDQNSTLLAGVRIADKFYRDFLPDGVDEHTRPKSEVPHVDS